MVQVILGLVDQELRFLISSFVTVKVSTEVFRIGEEHNIIVSSSIDGQILDRIKKRWLRYSSTHLILNKD